MEESQIRKRSPLSGGSICKVEKIETLSGETFVLKSAVSPLPSDFFVKEAHGLKCLKDSGCIKTPKVIDASDSRLLLEFIPSHQQDEKFWENLGKDLARLHQSKVKQMGLNQDNYIGGTPQKNTPHRKYEVTKDWIDFFWGYRLEYQVQLLKSAPQFKDLQETLEKKKNAIYTLLSKAQEEPCLLHGDLWKGNVLAGPASTAYLIDPAIYYGHRESDIAMTRMFGSFHYSFYESYQRTYPLCPEWRERIKVYQLYHLLNHWNLFGNSYANSVLKTLGEL